MGFFGYWKKNVMLRKYARCVAATNTAGNLVSNLRQYYYPLNTAPYTQALGWHILTLKPISPKDSIMMPLES